MRPCSAAPASLPEDRRIPATALLPALLAAAAILFHVPVLAAPPSPLDQSLWVFPGSLPSPPGSTTAALAQSDRWLGEEPFYNPAFPPIRNIELSGQMLRVNRQDLRPQNREFDEQPIFIDAAGGWAAFPLRSVALAAYVFQPVLHLEDNAFQRGVLGGPTPPASVQSSTSMREVRAGLAGSHAFGLLRVGIGGEWTMRSDTYETIETSGAPESGTRRITLSGGAPGVTAGLHWGASGLLRLPPGKRVNEPLESNLEVDDDEGVEMEAPRDTTPPVLPKTLGERLTVGVGVRILPALSLDVEQTLALALGDSSATFTAERQSGWEAGGSVAYRLLPAFTVLAGVSGRSAQDWDGLDASAGAAFDWSIGGSFHDSRDAWVARFGFGEERQDNVPESRAGVLSFGLGWQLGGGVLETGLLHRSIEHEDQPRSYEYRVVVSYASR